MLSMPGEFATVAYVRALNQIHKLKCRNIIYVYASNLKIKYINKELYRYLYSKYVIFFNNDNGFRLLLLVVDNLSVFLFMLAETIHTDIL